jgi:hypothetical protein
MAHAIYIFPGGAGAMIVSAGLLSGKQVLCQLSFMLFITVFPSVSGNGVLGGGRQKLAAFGRIAFA